MLWKETVNLFAFSLNMWISLCRCSMRGEAPTLYMQTLAIFWTSYTYENIMPYQVGMFNFNNCGFLIHNFSEFSNKKFHVKNWEKRISFGTGNGSYFGPKFSRKGKLMLTWICMKNVMCQHKAGLQFMRHFLLWYDVMIMSPTMYLSWLGYFMSVKK